MISLAGRDILHSWGKFVLTGLGLGLLIGVTLTMAGVYRGMVDDARALLGNSGADLWIVQQDTQGPYAESSSLRDDVVRSVLGLPDVARAANVTYLTMQVRRSDGAGDVRAMVVGFEPGQPGEPGYLVAGRQITRSHYEAVADVKAEVMVDLTNALSGGIAARYNGPDDSNMYWGGITKIGTTYYAQICRNLNGSWGTALTSVAVSGPIGKVRFEVVGSSLKLFFNDTQVGSTTDTTILTGRVGIRGATGASFDNFKIL